jgi:hypothetical protein
LFLIHLTLLSFLLLLVLVAQLEDRVALGDSADYLRLLDGLFCQLILKFAIILLKLGLDVLDQTLRVSINQKGFWVILVLLQYA